jgi:hypothetical protein
MRISGAASPTIRLISAEAMRQGAARTIRQPRAPALSMHLLRGLNPILGLLFSALVVVGFAQLLAVGGHSALTLGLAGGLVIGALLAERAWVNGELWRGLRGMLLWCGLIWLVAEDVVVPWVLPLLLGWCALHPRWYARRHTSMHIRAAGSLGSSRSPFPVKKSTG